jgi:hypothetical protein
MIIYNTTFLVSDRIYGTFIKWIKEKHIPFCVDSDYFTEATLSRIVPHEPQEGTSISLQLKAPNRETIEMWQTKELTLIEKEIADLFSTEVLHFSTLMEII